MSKHILITGGGCFIGSHLVLELIDLIGELHGERPAVHFRDWL
jgi:nucleoside-diphosphate-sugar epimerase